ncbi:MAG: Rhodanese [uncultured Thiotrichaceae bacterium]|uniref:Rhodanese n=1 Tax=uncultured Thiotrichaceae bacterium TaxID=298394 RepID=A0A6S6SJI7_9GAMM|nr:MAG: Rhodanese [uncultured Thiotrichaceae bacterium]
MKKIMNTGLLALAFLVISACTSTPVDKGTDSAVPSGKGIVNINNQELQVLMDKNVTLVDIRRPEEWSLGVIPGSKKVTFFMKDGSINPELIPQLKRVAPTDKPVALICRTGNRTQVGSLMIKTQLGYPTVYNVEKGITHWYSEGRAIAKR